MASFRFETYENVFVNHTLSKVNWTQAAQWAFLRNLDKRDWTIASVKQLDDNKIEIVKRRDFNKSLMYKLGLDQQNIYERVIIDRTDKSVALDRLDINWLKDEPFLAKRDLFLPSKRGGETSMDFVRHLFWVHKMSKMCEVMCSHFCAWSYRRSFRSKEIVNPWKQ